jgi:hypothetical protein
MELCDGMPALPGCDLIDEPRADRTRAELSDDDLECVVGGLARPWTETGLDGWLVEPVKSVL